ncbi:MAG TPA: hypothetical protein VIT68_04685, partial [Candidatus Gracilibacteria bacterium]
MSEETNTPPSTTTDQIQEVGHEVAKEIMADGSTEKGGFLDNIKKMWRAHIDKNKAKAEARKATLEDQGSEAGQGVSSKGNGNPAESTVPNPNPVPPIPTNGKQPLIVEADFFENFDPKKDLKKLDPETRKRIKDAEKLFQEGTSTMKDLIAPSSMEITARTLNLNGKHVKSFFVFNYPRFLDANWLSQVINFPTTLDVSIFIYPEESGHIMKVLRKKVAEMRSTMRIQKRKGMVEDVGLETALQDAEELRGNLQKGVERFFQIGLYFTVYADTKDQLDSISKQLETVLGGKLVMTRTADFRTERAFNTTLPQCTDEMEVIRNMNTGPASTIFPFVSNDLTSNQGILYGLNRHNNSLIIMDRFGLENANSVTFAKSGAGKSYAVKL